MQEVRLVLLSTISRYHPRLDDAARIVMVTFERLRNLQDGLTLRLPDPLSSQSSTQSIYLNQLGDLKEQTYH